MTLQPRKGAGSRFGLLVIAGALAAACASRAGATTPPLWASTVEAGTGGFVINGETGSRAGHALARGGDIDNDGLPDVLVGGYYRQFGNGGAWMVPGRVGAGSPAVALSQVALGTGGFVVGRNNLDPHHGSNGYAGWSAAALGDINGDGFGDLVMGAPQQSMAFVVHGRTAGPRVTLSALMNGTGGFLVRGVVGDRAGYSVAGAGDVNGDGLPDVVMGDPSPLDSNGRAYVVFGKTDTSAVALSAVEAGTGGFAIFDPTGKAVAGVRVAGVGDFNGDGFADVAVAASSYGPVTPPSPSPSNHRGAVYVVFGKTSTTPVQLSSLVAQGAGVMARGELATPNCRLGTSMAALGDVNGDGLGDVGFDGSGKHWVLFGRSDAALLETSDLEAGQGGFVVYRPSVAAPGPSRQGMELARYAKTIAGVGDANGDGLADLLVYATGSSQPTTTRVFLAFGKSSTAAVYLSSVDNGSTGLRLSSSTSNRFGETLAGVGDINGDGMPDMGVWTYDGHGKSHIFHNPLTPTPTGRYRTVVPAGDPPPRAIGTVGAPDDATAPSDARVWLDFDGGSGPGPNGSSIVEVHLVRDNASLAGGVFPAATARTSWLVESDRAGMAACDVKVRYTESEVAGLAEGSLVLYAGPSVDGPFAPIAGFALDPARNEAAGMLSSLPAVLLLATAAPGVPPPGDATADGVLNVADVTAIENLVNDLDSGPLAGDGDVNDDGEVDSADAALLVDHLVNGAPLP